MIPLASALLSPTGLKIGIGAAVLMGAWWWHSSAVRDAKQEAAAETRATVQTELEAQHAIETQKYQQLVDDLQQRFNDLAKTRAASKQVIEVITKQAEVERAEVQNLDANAVRAAIRQRLAGAATATVNGR